MPDDGFDPKVLEALRLLAERPEILKAAMALASAQSVQHNAPKPTVAELWNEWLPTAARLAKGTQKSRATYQQTFAKFRVRFDDGTEGTIADLPWDKVTPRVAEIYRLAREATDNGQGGTIAGGTINRELQALASVLQWHVDSTKKIPANPMKGWRRVDESGDARQTYLTPEQAKRFIEAGPPLFQDIALVAYRCAGLRHTEARLLRKSEVDFVNKVINLPNTRNKNKKPRVVPFASDVEAILRRNCEISRGPYVFVSPKDHERVRPVPSATSQNWIKKARERSGIVGFDGENVVLHTLRHCAVTDLLEAKIAPTTVMAVAAMSPRTLQRYAKFGPAQQESLRAHMESRAAEPTPERSGPRRAPASRPGRAVRR